MVRIRAVLGAGGGAIMQCKAGGWFRAWVGLDTRDSCFSEEIHSRSGEMLLLLLQ